MKLISRTIDIGLSIALIGTICFAQDNPKPRVYVIQSDTWSAGRTYSGSLADFLIGSRGGGSPQTAEIIKTFGERCKESIVNIEREKADYIVLLEHEGGKGLLRVDNKFAIFDPSGDAIESRSTRSLGNSVDDACKALKKDWEERRFGRIPRATGPAVSQTPRPITTLDLREAGGTETTSAVTFQSEPEGAEIEIDGKFAGNSPSLLQLRVGDHKVTIQRSGYRPWEKTIIVIAGGNILVLAELVKDSQPVSSPVSMKADSQEVPRLHSATGDTTTHPDSGKLLKGSNGIELVFVPAGNFSMGSTDGEKYERPIRKVAISDGFWMGRNEVTQLQWFTVMGTNPSSFNKCGGNCPVDNVSWDDVQRFIAKMNANNDGYFYSLPTEAQWEYAARAGTTGKFAGNLADLGWYNGNSAGRTHAVGTKQPNAFGLFDMHGNLWEWCEDWYGDYTSGAETNPRGAAKGKYRVLRGGSWKDGASDARSSYRGGLSPSTKYKDLGFRVVARPR